jgi:nanoRNase/pAp phosphatase (c-di-AMP/oligoRNAs hydrolase)
MEHLQQNALKYNDCDVLRILHTETETKKTYSLRSLKEHIKVDEMARHFGGNGHEKAAGYSIDKFI